MIIKTTAYPRAALVGNPSDGYHGKTIAFVFRNYSAEVELYETPELELLPAKRDDNRFGNLEELAADVALYGYYGGIRLLKAAAKIFLDHCHRNRLKLEAKNFTMRYRSSIPNRLGLAGSSAIITAAMRAMFRFYGLTVEPAVLANLVLATERDELNIPAGLQDRVAQAYNTPVYMDFDREHMLRHGVGRYEKIEIPADLNLYVAYRTDLAEGSEVLHSRLRGDFEAGVPRVLDAMREWGELTCRVREAIEKHNYGELPALLNRNFDLRCEVCSEAISEKNLQMVQAARSTGASAKFTGSGGAIIGTYEDEAMFRRLEEVLHRNRINVIKPEIVTEGEVL